MWVERYWRSDSGLSDDGEDEWVGWWLRWDGLRRFRPSYEKRRRDVALFDVFSWLRCCEGGQPLVFVARCQQASPQRRADIGIGVDKRSIGTDVRNTGKGIR